MQLNREGVVWFGDASVGVREEHAPRGASYQERQDWEKNFKRYVFARIVQQLNRMGWTCKIPQEYIEQYSLSFARDRRECVKGDLKGWLDISGRCIKFEMWQDVANITREDGNGKYEFNKTEKMPYLLRIRMEWVRRRLRNYLCNIFAGYTFDDEHGDPRGWKAGPGLPSPLVAIEADRKRNSHVTRPKEGDRNGISADGAFLQDGVRVYSTDYRGRVITGIAYHNINSMWWIVSGYERYNKSSFEIFANPVPFPRKKRNESRRRSRLEGELAKAIKKMDFLRANTLKGILFPTDEQVYVVRHPEGKYHRSNFSGYTDNVVDAGKFTLAEIGRYASDNEVIPLSKAS